MIKELKVCCYNSLEEFIAWTNTCPDYNCDYGLWTGANSYEDALKIVREGVDLDRAKVELDKLEHSRPEMSQVMDVSGSVVNMDAYLSGVPENMMEFPISEEPVKFLNLYVDFIEHSGVSSEHMVNKAVAIASTIDHLENNGYRVAVTACSVLSIDKALDGRSVPGTTAIYTAIKVKEYSQPLSLGQLIGCFHSCFLRVLGFRHYEGIYRNVGGTPRGIGRSASWMDIDKVLSENSDSSFIYIPNSRVAGHSLSTVESALAMVKDYMKMQTE